MADESQRPILSVMMHNMKTPPFSIRGYSEMASASLAKGPTTAARYLAVVQKNVTQVEGTLRDLSLASRLESKRLRFDPILLDIRGTVERAAEVMRPAAQLRGVSLHMQIPEQPLLCTVDGTYVAQVFENLLDNAIKSCRAGDSVKIRAYRNGRHVRVDVADTGAASTCTARRGMEVCSRWCSRRREGEKSWGDGGTVIEEIWVQACFPLRNRPSTQSLGRGHGAHVGTDRG